MKIIIGRRQNLDTLGVIINSVIKEIGVRSVHTADDGDLNRTNIGYIRRRNGSTTRIEYNRGITPVQVCKIQCVYIFSQRLIDSASISAQIEIAVRAGCRVVIESISGSFTGIYRTIVVSGFIRLIRAPSLSLSSPSFSPPVKSAENCTVTPGPLLGLTSAPMIPAPDDFSGS